ncbi:MAG: AAA family ATPase [Lachnospiraceae bacterium]|nr:AAA family ATPase [Lachnospiraceae bacterium]
MSKTIAVAGKGGVGKTTTCGLLIDYLCRHGKKPVLAVDADANSNLNEVLGVEVEATLGEIREEIANAELSLDNPIPLGMSKQDYANFKFNSALIEEKDFDMLVMGRTQGKGCYCYVNGVLQAQIQKFAGNYKYVVVDNEAGMEHISRGLLPHVDIVILVSDCSRRGIQAVGRIAKLIKEIELNPSEVKLIVNRAPGGKLNDGILEEIKIQELDLAGVLPHDEDVYEFDCEGKPTVQLPKESKMRVELEKILDGLDL